MWKQKSRASVGFISWACKATAAPQPANQARASLAGASPPPPFQVNIVPTQGTATPAPALLHNCCTLNLNLQLHKCCSHGLTAPRYRRIAPLAGALRRASCCLFTHPVQELLEGQGRSDMEAVTLEAHTPRSQTSIPVTKKRQYDQKRDEKRIPKET